LSLLEDEPLESELPELLSEDDPLFLPLPLPEDEPLLELLPLLEDEPLLLELLD